MGPQFGLRFALRLKHDVAGYGTNQDGIWFGMSRSQIYLTNSGDGAGHYGTGYQLFNLANYDLFRAAGDGAHTGFTRFRVEDKGGSGDIIFSVKLGDGWWQKTHRLYNISSTGYTVYNYATKNTASYTVKNGLGSDRGYFEIWHHSGTQKQTRVADVSVNEAYPALSNYVEKPIPSLSSFSLKSATHTVSANVSIGTEEEVYGQVGDANAKYTARPLTISLKPGRTREAYMAEFTATDNKGHTGQTVAQTILPERSSTLGRFAGKAQHAAKQMLTSGTSMIRTEKNFLIGVSEGTHQVTTGHHNNGVNEDASTRYYVTVNTQEAETIGAITAKALETLNVDANGNLSAITLYAKGSASDWSAKVLEQGDLAIHASYKNADSEVVTGSISSANTNAVSLSGTTATVQSIGTKNAEKAGSAVLSATYTASYNNSVTITKTDTLTVVITAKEFTSIVPVASSGTTNLAEKALPDAKAICASTAKLGSFSAASAANGTVTAAGIYTPTQTATGIYTTATTAYGYNAAGYTVAFGTVEAQYMTANAENESFTYDGTAKSITVRVPAGVTMTYGTTAGSYSAQKPTITDVGSLVVYWKMEKAGYSAVTGYATVKVTPKELTPKATADNKYYNASAAVESGTVYLDTPIAGDNVGVTYTSFVFENATVGANKNVYATGIALTGDDKNNYVLKQDFAQTQASIYVYDFKEVHHISPYFNMAKGEDMKSAIQAAMPFVLANNSVFDYTRASYGEVAESAVPTLNASVGDYVRTNDWTYALGIVTDTMTVEIYENNILVIFGAIHVTTGKNTVYGDNYVDVNDSVTKAAVLTREGEWKQGESYSASITTNTPKFVTFKAYLRAGESLEVGTEIGMYYGRVDVSVSRGMSEQAKDYINAFFPVKYDNEKYIISNMHSTTLQNEINTNRGDYLSDVPEFKAPSDGLYNVQIKVTGSSYLLDAIHGLGDRYQGNDPADPPKTTIRYITIKSE